MPPHTSWLNFVPGFHWLEHTAASAGPAWLFKSSVHAQHVASILLVTLVILLIALAARKGHNRAAGDILPDGTLTARNFVEMLMEAVLTIMQYAMPHKAALRHFWLIGTLAFFILFSNLLGLIPGFLPPTENLNTNFACASIVFIYYNAYAFYKLGLGHLAHMANPVGERWSWVLAPLFLPVEIISHCIRPMSLSVRLFCNMAGDHLVLGVFIGLFPLLLPVPLLALGLFIAVVQTLVFVLLSCVYIGEVEANVEHHLAAHGHEAAAH